MSGINGGRATLSAELIPGWFVDLAGIAQRIDGDDSQYADEEGAGLSREQPGRPAVLIRFHAGQPRHPQGQRRSPLPFDHRRQLAGRRREFRRLDRGTTSASCGQHSQARAVSNETRLWRPMADGYSWLAGFSTIVHRYEVSREIAEDGAIFDLSGAENRVRETTCSARSGSSSRRGSKRALVRATPCPHLSGFGRASEPAGLRPAGAGGHRPEGATIASRRRRCSPGRSTASPSMPAISRASGRADCRSPATASASIATTGWRRPRQDFAMAGPAAIRFDLQGSVTLSRW